MKERISRMRDSGVSRRDLLRTGATLAAIGGVTGGTAACSSGNETARPEAPFNSMREYVAALDARGLLVRFPRVDQDAYEATALMYRMRDRHGMRGAPAMLFDEVRIDGRWVRGAVARE